MHRKHKHDIIIILSLLGFGISVYLATAHFLGYTPPCTVTKGCEEVLNSKYASLFGIPLSVWGMVFFSGAIISALLANHYLVWKRLLASLLGVGALLALVFLFIQFFVLKRVCQYCLATDILTILIFLWDLNIEHRHEIRP